MLRSCQAVLIGLTAVLLTGCGTGAEPSAALSPGSAPPVPSPGIEPTGTGSGLHLDAGQLDAPPAAAGDVITAEQAEAVSGTVVAAWLVGDRELAERFVSSPEVLDALFDRPVPSQELPGEGGYCSEDPDTGGYLGCSYSVADDSPDGILALATGLEVVDGLVMVRDVGFADWND